MFRGAGTALNVVTVLVGSGIGIALRGRLPERIRDVVTDGLGLVTLLIAALNAAAVRDRHLVAAVGSAAPTLIVLGAVLLGHGIDQLALKSTLDGFASIAFAASLGWGVAAAAVVVAVFQGLLTLVGWALGDLLPLAQVAALTATGGVLLVGVALRLLRIRQVAVADLLPALVAAPILVEIVSRTR